MDHPTTGSGRLPILPQSFRPCVWMSAGLLSYKHCDREYDCDNCPLDRALRGLDPPLRGAGGEEAARRPGATAEAPQSAARTRIDPAAACVQTLEFPDDRFYHRAHTWAKIIAPNEVRCGIDAFAAQMLADLRLVVLPAVQARLLQGELSFWITGDAELIPLRAPVSGTVIRANDKVHEFPELIASSPYHDGWLVDVACYRPLDEQRDLIGAAELKKRSEAQMTKVYERAARMLAPGHSAVGATMRDGGERVTDLRRLLGGQRYRRLVKAFLR